MSNYRMRNFYFILLFWTISSCGLFEPRDVDWKQEWNEWESDLKELAESIKTNPSKYSKGNNDFPEQFDYPFDDGFFLTKTDSSITVTFYMDRGVLDHYKAFIYTNDSREIRGLEANVENGGNDEKLEDNWYVVND